MEKRVVRVLGVVAKATVLKDRATRQSRGVAFILFVSRDDAIKAVKGIDKKVLNGRTLRASVAADNGRASEFIRKKVYKDKSRCYECGEEGHLSYECPRNFLGARERPVAKKGRGPGGGTVVIQGFAIGNGLTDPGIQYAAYADYALDMGIITQSAHDRINKILRLCETAIKLCGTYGTISCMAAYLVCNTIFSAILARVGDMNYYDIRKKCEGSLCYNFSNLEKFLNQKSVRDVLGVRDIDFVSCSPTVYPTVLMDWMRNLEVGIPTLLKESCLYMLENTILYVTGLVHNAGHMVPMDQPKASLEMLKRWMQGSLSESKSSVSSENLVSSM
ncbi:Serine carboxypeptidase-like 49 [Forsythia ovata]|uniref:Serine carboxypeptidase-like 49 n=1 Tax=Forsythia ovata TaxID=205694 RepID=A0ABD1X0U7_9LAMI